MGVSLRFLIVDGYPKVSREEFDSVGMTQAGHLYAVMLIQNLHDAEYEILYTSDPGEEIPEKEALNKYNGILWPGCNLTVYNTEDERVIKMLDLVTRAYEVGVPQFGSCWAAQIAVCAAGGKVASNPKGKEMGIARKIHLTTDGQNHPMFEGKPKVFDGFISHDDIITELPEGAVNLATNDFSEVQAVAVQHKQGIFWAVQYHPEYNLHEMARLIVARQEKLIQGDYFRSLEEVDHYTELLEIIAADPSRKDLRWQLGIDDDLLLDSVRQCEFVNWLQSVVIPMAEI
jgi:GMP synthase (glutamine-hydrolysing)